MYEECPEHLRKLITRLSSASGRHGEVRSDRDHARRQSKRVATARNQLHEAIALELRTAFRAGAELRHNVLLTDKEPPRPEGKLDRQMLRLQALGETIRNTTKETKKHG